MNLPRCLLIGIMLNVLIALSLTGCQAPSPTSIAEKSTSQNGTIPPSSDSAASPAPSPPSGTEASSLSSRTLSNPYAVYYESLDFLDAETGWLVKHISRGGSLNIYALFQTKDQGKHWRLVEHSTQPLDQLDFLTAQHGWALSIARKVSILSTQDGGETWHTAWSVDGKALKIGYSPNRLQFFDMRDGYAKIGNVLLMTGDGGRSWSMLNLTKQLQQPGAILDTADFQSTKEGWMAVHSCRQGAQGSCTYAVYHTANQGKDWHNIFRKTTVHHESQSSLSFVNPMYGWYLLGGYHCAMHGCPDSDLYHTADGGKSWTKAANNWGAFPWRVRFTNTQSGYVLAEGGAAGSPASMMGTNDGGESWHAAKGLFEGAKPNMTNFGGIDFDSSGSFWLSATIHEGSDEYEAVYRYDGTMWQQEYQEKAAAAKTPLPSSSS